METKLKAYYWSSEIDAETGIGVIAENCKEAKKIGGDYWGLEFGHEEPDGFILQRCKIMKNVNTDGMQKGVVTDFKLGMKKGIYAWIEDTCDMYHTELHLAVVHDNKVICDDCETKIEEGEEVTGDENR